MLVFVTLCATLAPHLQYTATSFACKLCVKGVIDFNYTEACK